VEPSSGLPNCGPYAAAYVDLDEGFRIMTNVAGVKDPTRDIQCGCA
jgi:hypothetical protein